LGELEEVQPAGAYTVETDEELLEGLSFPAYRRVSTLIRLHAKPGRPGIVQTLYINPKELDEALMRDQAPADMLFDRDAIQKTLDGTTESRQKEADSLAIKRSEDEGMGFVLKQVLNFPANSNHDD